jgi:adenylyl-sulfate reductase (glutathione)
MEAAKAFKDTQEGLLVVYAPWCQHCQAMEEELTKFAGANPGIKVAKYRGDVERGFSEREFEVKSFPTIVSVKGGKITKYESEARSANDFLKFMKN